ncbi:hypothetical protein D3C86_1797260 [compost metagenome]
MRKARIGLFDRCRQGIDHFPLDAVRQMAAIGNILELAPAVGNILVLGKRVGDEGEDPQIVLESGAQRFRRFLSGFRLRLLQHV